MRIPRAAFAVLLCSWMSSPAARAQERTPSSSEGSRPDFAFASPIAEIGLGAFTGGSNFSYLLPQRNIHWRPSVPRAFDPDTSNWSDMTGALGGSLLQLGAGFAFEAAYLDAVGVDKAGVSATHEVIIEVEALLLTSGLTALIKRITGRCRPRAYRERVPCAETDAFPSGHTSSVAAFSGARIVRLAYTPMNDAFAFRAASLGISETAVAVTAALRVLSGSHSWEDVLVGAIMGQVTGITIGLVHPNVPLKDGAPPTGSPPSTPQVFQVGGEF